MMIVTKYPCLKDVGSNCLYETVKDKVTKDIQNQIESAKTKDVRKLKRYSVASVANAETSDIVDTTTTEYNAESGREIEFIAKYYSRRSLVQLSKKNSKREILESIPHYKEFANFREDFPKIPPVSVMGHSIC
ncbi:hypothetical protein OUZ56_011294 [Daphnia magna]|uniref:Uncharacterized protein n=1 Tax=Daphnia magna TaxID=35525 RepID=A0ABQ9YZQ4_9CRUS|nr:hypothetical protein OUZ56_011294 [Daphnia magna]